MELVLDRMNKIHNILLTLISQIQEMKTENGEKDRDVRQWEKEMKSTYNPFLEERDKLIAVLKQKQAVDAQEKEKEILRAEEIKLEAEKKKLTEINQQQTMFEEQAGLKRYRLEKEMWKEKYKAELAMVEKKLKAKEISHQDQAKLPKLQITQFNGTAADWVRFENKFITQVDKKQISDGVKFGYLLQMVCPRVRTRIANLKPGSLGYKTAWERLCRIWPDPNGGKCTCQ